MKKEKALIPFWDGGLRVATQLAGDAGRSKYGKGYEPSGSSPECSESGSDRRHRRIPTCTGSLKALCDPIFSSNASVGLGPLYRMRAGNAS